MSRTVYAFYDIEHQPKALLVQTNRTQATQREVTLPVGMFMERFKHLTPTQVATLTYVDAVAFENRMENPL